MDVSPRMRRHLAAAGVEVPAGGDCPTGRELAERVLSPVAALPEVAPHLRLGTRAVLKNPEPNFYILGIKSYGRNNTFLMQVGWQQVDEVFGLIGGAG